jgi:hypothetical protein
MLQGAQAFFHVGTTMGLECCFLDTPSIVLDIDGPGPHSPISIWSFVHQYQIERYLLLAGYPNVVTKAGDLDGLFTDLTRDRSRFLDYNRRVSKGMRVKSFNDFSRDLIARLSS